MERRDFLSSIIAGGSLASLGLLSELGCSSSVTGPLQSSIWPPLNENPKGYAGLATSLVEEGSYEPEIKGNLPPDLKGCLYRNGPALFDRGPDRKRMILDGDGMVHQFCFEGGGVKYRNRFVQTGKYAREQSASKFVYPTWATPIQGGRCPNRGLDAPNTSSVTVLRSGKKLVAFDDDQVPIQLDPKDLNTLGRFEMGTGQENNYKAHFKIDGVTGHKFFFGTTFGRKNTIYTATYDSKLKNLGQFTKPLAKRVYLHDWSVTENHFVQILHPAEISIGAVLKKSLGYGTLAGLISWDPDDANIIYVQDKDGRDDPIYMEAPPVWVWHTLNAYEEKGEIVLDFVGSSDVLSGDSEGTTFYSVMRGEDPTNPSTNSPLMRYVIDLKHRSLQIETVADEDQYEMPFVNQRLSCHKHRFGYVASYGSSDRFWSSIGRIDTVTGTVDTFDFGRGEYVTEPVFVPKPNYQYRIGSKDEPGWLLTLVYSDKTKKSYLAVLKSDSLEDGPIARLDLRHHVPLSLHGFWYEGPFQI